MFLTQQDKITGLLGITDSGPKRRDSVLRVLTDLFILDGDRQTPAEREMHEELMVNMALESGLVMRKEMAERLASHPRPPARLARLLAGDDIAVAGSLLRHSPALDDAALAEIVLTSSIEHARAAACRAMLGTASTDAIIALEDREAMLDVARNTDATLSADGISQLCRLAKNDAAMAQALLTRTDLRPELTVALFWYASSQLRETILERLAGEDIGMSAWLNAIPRLNAPVRHADAETLKSTHEGLSSILLSRRTDDFRDLFGRILGLKPALAQRILNDESGEPFAIACRAAQLSVECYTTLLILYNPVVGQSVQRVFALGGLYESIPGALAWRMLEAWNAGTRDEAPVQTPAAAATPARMRGAIHDAFAVRTERPDRSAGYVPTRPAAQPATARPGPRVNAGESAA